MKNELVALLLLAGLVILILLAAMYANAVKQPSETITNVTEGSTPRKKRSAGTKVFFGVAFAIPIVLIISEKASWLVTAIANHPWESLITVASFAVVAMIGSGIWEHIKAKESPGTKFLVSILGVMAALFMLFGFAVGWDKVPGYGAQIRAGTNSFLAGSGFSTPKPGTDEVTDFQYVYIANGTYTLKDDKRTRVDYPARTCPRVWPSAGVLVLFPDAGNFIDFLSAGGDRTVQIRTLAAGETWHGFTC